MFRKRKNRGINNFDKVYYINYEHRNNRVAHINDVLSNLDVDPEKVKRIEGVYVKGNETMSYIKSQLVALKDAAKNRYNNVLILEDDFIAYNDFVFIDSVNDLFQSNLDWDIISMCDNVTSNECEYNFLVKIEEANNRSAYAINKSSIKTVIEYFNELVSSDIVTVPLDNIWNKLQLNWYGFKQPLGTKIVFNDDSDMIDSSILFMITTYNRLRFLEKTIDTWNKTRNKNYKWTLIVADDGSNDGTLEYLDSLKISDVEIRIIKNSRRGVHHQTNQLFKTALDLEFDFGFKCDDDLVFLKSGWDDLYINAANKTKYYHLIHYSRNKERLKATGFEGILESYVDEKSVQGALWTFNREVLEKVGFFDLNSFNVFGYGHVDFSMRCCRMGFNNIENPYDIANSNDFVILNSEEYFSEKVGMDLWNSKEQIAEKQRILEEDRGYVGYNELGVDAEGKDIKDNLFSIVIPTMWCSDKIYTMLNIYEESSFVGEVIIIDNNPNKSPNLDSFKKVKKYTKGENIYVNPSWNWGFSLSNYKLILANDDIIINKLDSALQLLLDTDYDIVGMDIKDNGDNMNILSIDDFPANSYGCFMYIKKYFYIPEQFKIWYGDTFLFNFNSKRGILKNSGIIANKSETINSNIPFFRNQVGVNDIDEYNIISKNTLDKLNIIIRTSNRPLFFKKCIESIKNNHLESFLHIIVDNTEDIEYVKEYVGNFEYKYYFVNREFVSNICSKIKIDRAQFIYNYYFNIVKPFLNGWCIFLDDDDQLTKSPEFKNDVNNIYLFRTKIKSKIVPNDDLFGKAPILNNISGLSILFHSSQMVDWLPQRGGDFDFINTLYHKFNHIWINEILSETQAGGNLGKRNDIIKHDKPITVNIATYPERKESFLMVINSLIKIYTIDLIRVYLNEYDSIPEEFPKNKKIMYFIGKQNLKDSGKFYWASVTNEYYFTVDDDLIYSESYFIDHLILLQKYESKIFVTLHGKIMKDYPVWMNDCIESYHCLHDVQNNVWINNGGTGVMLFDSGYFNIPFNIFKYHGMADLCISTYAQENNIPILCRKHDKNELKYIEVKNTLFDQRDQLKEMHTDILNKIKLWKLYKIN